MPQALKVATLIQFWSWVILHFPLLALWGIKNWPPSMKVEMLEKFLNKMGLLGCKWSNVNAPGTQSCHSHSIIELGDFPLLALWNNKNWPPSIKVKIFGNKMC